MKYKDYYATLGVPRTAKPEEIRKAYRKLAQEHHPDVSKAKGAEEKFKEIGEAYQTLKDAEKRAAYDQLGTGYRPGEEIRPPPDWGDRFRHARGGGGNGGAFSFDDVDLSDLFAGFGGAAGRGGRSRANQKLPGEDFEVGVSISLEDAFKGTQTTLNLSLPERDAQGQLRRVPRKIEARIPKGATDGLKLRLRGQGGKGVNGGSDGDIYLNVSVLPHRLFRVEGNDLHLDLPLSPWEAALGATIEVPTLAGAVSLKIPPGTAAGRKMRLSKRGLPKIAGGEGDLYATVQIVNPVELTAAEREHFAKLSEISDFDPRAHFPE